MAEAEVGAPPYIRMEDNLTWWTLGATIAVEAGKNWELGLSAVLEEKDGTKSYWALAHAGGQARFPSRRIASPRSSPKQPHMTLFGIDRLLADPELAPPARRQARRAARASRRP